ncbi:hypothetical protein [Avibacterium paragallinarum]|uniref:Uncharacterized protein n=5 Tax=Avibacterium paragallinarum TaxID=728 RepID=A0ABU7QKD3_AVIPA|nr:hypothetical protein [Avibacterium paragallinarum]MEE3608157.1 hypothetical protein [Avibacterium paragallinarum]MEE3622169.1 hypothetical protein [Avibacterium paragallinarum]MEE3669286.1 hypothetical protein [Avibacterium paragallinarum]MEE3681412.1 hypothetical protein [Avibacterium paragallinarum]MEE4386722.1 hypothetical protein [Avibacterium paragallinarum]
MRGYAVKGAMMFTEFPTYPPTSSETNQQGASHCRAILGDASLLQKAFNALADGAKRAILHFGKVTRADLASASLLGDRFEHYSTAGQLKLIEGMRQFKSAAEALPAHSALNCYRKALQKGETQGARGQQWHSC